MTEEKAEEKRKKEKITLVLGTIGSDAHTIGIMILERTFR